MTIDDEGALQQLIWATQALALEPDEQFSLFPDFVDKPFELVDDFMNWYGATRWRTSLGLEAHGLDELRTLYGMVDRLPGEAYTMEAVRGDAAWQAIRMQARQVLKTFGWGHQLPPSGRSVYVPSGPER
jgi:hypothetical protein